MSANLLVRPATQDDARGLAKVHVASWKAAYNHLLPKEKLAQLDVEERERAWRDRLTDAAKLQLRVWVAILNDEVVGFALTQPSADADLLDDVHELTALYLLPSVWRTGIGTELLSAAQDSLRDAGIRQSALWVIEGNEGAKSFYEGKGWTFDKREPSFKDFGAAALRYRKSL